MSKRTRFEVLPAAAGDWKVTRDSVVLDTLKPKALAIQLAVDRARAVWRAGQPSQLLIKGRDGRIQDERTYGNDPRSTKG